MGKEHCINTETTPVMYANKIYVFTEDNIKAVNLSENCIEDFASFDTLKQNATTKGILEKYLHETGYYRFDIGIGRFGETLLISCGSQGQYYIWGINKDTPAFEIIIDKSQLSINNSEKNYTIDNNVKSIILPR